MRQTNGDKSEVDHFYAAIPQFSHTNFLLGIAYVFVYLCPISERRKLSWIFCAILQTIPQPMNKSIALFSTRFSLGLRIVSKTKGTYYRQSRTHTYIHKNWDGIRDRNVNAWHFCENIVSWCDTLVLFVSIRFFPAHCLCRFIFILIQKLLHRMAVWETGLLYLSMILFCCSVGEKMNWKQYCINFCLHLLCVIICATTKTTITTNRTSFHLIIYFSFRRPTSHYALTTNSLCVYVYEIFTLTFAFVSRWHYFFVFSSLFALVYHVLYLKRAFFHLSSWFRFAQSFHVYSFSVVSQSFFLYVSWARVLWCFVLGYSCFKQWWVLHFAENREENISKKSAQKKWDRKREEKNRVKCAFVSMWIENLCQKKEDTNTRVKHFFSSWLCVFSLRFWLCCLSSQSFCTHSFLP